MWVFLAGLLVAGCLDDASENQRVTKPATDLESRSLTAS